MPAVETPALSANYSYVYSLAVTPFSGGPKRPLSRDARSKKPDNDPFAPSASSIRRGDLCYPPNLPPLEAYLEHLREIWTSKQLTNAGPLTGALEHLLGAYLETPYMSLFNNGTMALMIACQALNLSGEVITTPFTFPATPHVLSWSRITPVFADIDPMTMTIDPAAVESLVTYRTTGILGVHVYGLPCAVGKLQAVAEKFALRLVYDAAHALATRINDQPITSFGDVSMLSFHATKLFHTAEGGALVARDPAASKSKSISSETSGLRMRRLCLSVASMER